MSEYKYQHPTAGIIEIEAIDEDEALASLREIVARDFPQTDYEDWSDA
jgi:hypothetical protein